MPASPASPFVVPVRELPAHRLVTVGGDYVAAVLAGLPMREALGGPAADAGEGVLEVDLYGDGEGADVQVQGTARGHVTVACSRCVGPARVPFSEPIRVTCVVGPVGEAGAAGAGAPKAGAGAPKAEAGGGHRGGDGDGDDDGVELEADQLDVLPYDGEQVDLEPLLREQLVLAVPYAPLCREDCKGLCPQCGIDRNAETCACEAPPDPRFAALKGLKLPS